MATNNMRWQAPGNGKIFDDKLGTNSYMNKRTICVLTYIQENPKVLQKIFELEWLSPTTPFSPEIIFKWSQITRSNRNQQQGIQSGFKVIPPTRNPDCYN